MKYSLRKSGEFEESRRRSLTVKVENWKGHHDYGELGTLVKIIIFAVLRIIISKK